MKYLNSGINYRTVELTPTEWGQSVCHAPLPTPIPHRDLIQHPAGRGLARLTS